MISKSKNNKRVQASDGQALPASDWVNRFARYVSHDGAVLDIACGSGRQGRVLLERGHSVTFVDKDINAVYDLIDHPRARIIAGDLEAGPWPLGTERFQCVIVTNYLWRPNFDRLLAHLDGLLIYETFAEGNEQYGRPHNPDFLLRKGELFERVRGRCRVLAYEQHTRLHPAPAMI